MKHGKRLTRAEKLLLKKEGHNPKEYLRIKKLADCIVFVHRTKNIELPIYY